jgi:two-component system CheB/CheR fusion protein
LINRSGDEFETTDLREVLKNVKNDFEILIQQKGINLTIGELPSIDAIPLQMNQLFFNLLGNALKFTVEGRQPVITVSSRMLSEEEVMVNNALDTNLTYCEIMVQDNGVGFDQQYAEKVFEIFQRLNARTAYDGTGLGLAVCQKIVLNHNGIIHARSKENEGASFFVVLPLRHVSDL